MSSYLSRPPAARECVKAHPSNHQKAGWKMRIHISRPLASQECIKTSHTKHRKKAWKMKSRLPRPKGAQECINTRSTKESLNDDILFFKAQSSAGKHQQQYSNNANKVWKIRSNFARFPVTQECVETHNIEHRNKVSTMKSYLSRLPAVQECINNITWSIDIKFESWDLIFQSSRQRMNASKQIKESI